MNLNLGPVSFVEGFSLQFPEDVCANCGTRSEVFVAEQNTKVTRFLLLGGSEISFALPVSSCTHCVDSLHRRPLSLGNKALITGMMAGACATVLLMWASMGSTKTGFLADHPFLVSALAGLGLSWAWFRRHRAQAPQSSYYQPVRIRRLKRQFVDGTIEAMHLAFTNKDYRLAFVRANREAIRKGQLAAADA
ncbi:hypothetical protein H5407_00770 [Mitsuaria sp. WAJ17]|uniref:hypothetical protein n=1 Tax=Mitsuaria sp. WAJ17 TaxID=2761452 RepID=UPI0015FF9D5C|nr:hypothetical protein [Mitsuaria sp. WAJ17]MBB2483750.1 hypothetical protein [Mitsuaria sp. WAJ17]